MVLKKTVIFKQIYLEFDVERDGKEFFFKSF